MKVFEKLAMGLLCLIVLLSGCSTGSNPDNNNPSENIEQKFHVGDVVTINGVPKGIVFFIDENSDNTSGKILSLDKYKTMFCGLYTNACSSSYAPMLVSASSRTDGQANYDLWCTLLPDFEGNSYYNAWYWCKNIKGADWYIPAIEELKEIVRNDNKIFTTYAALKREGYEVSYFDKTSTWSSTPRGLVSNSSKPTVSMWFSDGTVSMICNENKFYVQPVRTFDKNTKGIGKYDFKPSFYNFEIPVVAASKHGTKVRSKITGKNFSTSGLGISKFKISCNKDSSFLKDASFSISGDNTIFVDFNIPTEAGDYTLDFSCGTESIKGILKVKDMSLYSTGSVLLNDGSIISYNPDSLSFTDDQKKQAIGVIFSENSYGIPLVVGLYNSAGGEKRGNYEWTNTNTIRSTYFTGVVCIPSIEGVGAASTATFTGDVNGADNWDYIYANTNYHSSCFPAFEYVNKYSSVFNLPENFSKGWYMPSLAELCEMYKNKEIINNVLSALGGVQLSNNNYWSSSQSEKSGVSAWTVRMSDGNIVDIGKTLTSNSYYSMNVCCIRSLE